MSATTGNAIARYQTGSSDEDQLQELIAQAWQDLLDDPTQRQAVATLLDCPADALSSDSVPFRARVETSGLGLGEVLIALASGFVLGLAKDAGGQLGKAAAAKLRTLWDDFMRKRVSPPGSGNLGRSKDEDPE